MSKKLRWNQIAETELLQTRVMTVLETQSVSPEGKQGNYIIMDAPDWVIVVPVLKDPARFVMVRQWRHGLKAESTEFPGGVIDEGELPEQAARRELLEETGFIAEKLTLLGSMSPNPALMTNKVHCFAAEQLKATGTQHLDPDEFVDYFTLSAEQVYEKMGSAEFPHALMAAALQLYRQHTDKKESPER
ncbi:NUDIX hydrolase [Treponema brennaborense]|uniref:GDP-mannose pyrophosphatase n=1 Tax=Treponema brennaborense (strain DSM 12168 / CIP 105900 / DD5/3) TaxID=906968 RepID=F4LKI4_TREBD|nr:NUDIX hydrolase [Treponema brennaborense]AEE17540.1 NUDIX hydrolase [Treponema brennaborense DSM 12168]